MGTYYTPSQFEEFVRRLYPPANQLDRPPAPRLNQQKGGRTPHGDDDVRIGLLPVNCCNDPGTNVDVASAF